MSNSTNLTAAGGDVTQHGLPPHILDLLLNNQKVKEIASDLLEAEKAKAAKAKAKEAKRAKLVEEHAKAKLAFLKAHNIFTDLEKQLKEAEKEKKRAIEEEQAARNKAEMPSQELSQLLVEEEPLPPHNAPAKVVIEATSSEDDASSASSLLIKKKKTKKNVEKTVEKTTKRKRKSSNDESSNDESSNDKSSSQQQSASEKSESSFEHNVWEKPARLQPLSEIRYALAEHSTMIHLLEEVYKFKMDKLQKVLKEIDTKGTKVHNYLRGHYQKGTDDQDFGEFSTAVIQHFSHQRLHEWDAELVRVTSDGKPMNPREVVLTLYAIQKMMDTDDWDWPKLMRKLQGGKRCPIMDMHEYMLIFRVFEGCSSDTPQRVWKSYRDNYRKALPILTKKFIEEEFLPNIRLCGVGKGVKRATRALPSPPLPPTDEASIDANVELAGKTIAPVDSDAEISYEAPASKKQKTDLFFGESTMDE
jgi:chemotaxis protein histidine kinase CheA